MLFKRLTCFVHVPTICLSDTSTDIFVLDSVTYREDVPIITII